MWWSTLLIIYLKYGEFSAKFHEEVVEIFRSRVVSPTFVACVNFMLTLKTVLPPSILWWFYTKTFYCENIEEKFQSILALKSLFHLRIILFSSQKLTRTMVFTSQEISIAHVDFTQKVDSSVWDEGLPPLLCAHYRHYHLNTWSHIFIAKMWKKENCTFSL